MSWQMRLNRLVLQGYKSFATRAEFQFPTGITAIVGPNGSGKSNIADAIRWVLGEQRMRALRGKSTADMIFAGGQRRPRAGMAEVSLTLDNSDGQLPTEFSEVTITRRAYRSGENEYLLNGARVRLRDIQELLAETGLCSSAYTVIGQGLVDAALSLHPQQRRTLIEEAAGIGLYRVRREEAAARLEETQRNLERVYDIISELSPRLQRLEKDAARAEEYRRITAHLERLQRTWYGYQWGRQQEALEQALKRAMALETRLGQMREEMADLSGQLQDLRRREAELRSRLRDWHRDSADLHEQTVQVRQELAVAEERARLLDAQRQELLAELDPLQKQIKAQADKVAQANAQLVQLEQELAEQRANLAACEKEWALVAAQAQEPLRQRALVEQELRAHRTRLEKLNSELNQKVLAARAEATRLAREQSAAEERARQLERRHSELQEEKTRLQEQREAQANRITRLREQVCQLERQVEEHRHRLAALEREWAALEQQKPAEELDLRQLEQELSTHTARLNSLQQELLEARGEEARLKGELEALNRLRATGSVYNTGIRAVLQADIEGVLGPLAALIQVTPEWEQAVEAALAAELRTLIVESTSVVERVRALLEKAGGRVTLLPLDGLRPPPQLPAGTRRCSEVTACDERVRPAVEALLGRVALCPDLASAQALLPAMPQGTCCITVDGALLRAEGALSVGQIEVGAGLLADERVRRELPARLATVHRRCQGIAQQIGEASERIAQLQAALEEARRRAAVARAEATRVWREKIGEARTHLAVAEESLRNHRSALKQEESLLARIEGQLTSLSKQLGTLEAERSRTLEHLNRLRAQEETAPGLGELTQQFEAEQRAEMEHIAVLEARLQELSEQAARAAEEAARIERETVGKARTQVAVAEESLRSRTSALQAEQALLDRLRAQLTARRQRAEELLAEHNAVVVRIQELREAVAHQEAQLHQVQTHIRPAEEELARLHDRQKELEVKEQTLRDRLRDLEARCNQAGLEVTRCQDELKALARRIEEELGLVELELSERVTAQTPLPLRPIVSPLPIVEELPEGLEEEIQRLKAHLRRLGPINPSAPEEYAELKERHRFLTEQSSDLEAASAKLRQLMGELDEIMERSFRETFEAIATRFSETFTALFNGGSARLELTEPDDPLNSGVEIVARPPGKRAQRLALLSGGERALTAVALLFSILQVSPTPFCVLDEVDAMLDEANV
ncbi:MAG: hypothetical protein N2508_03460, partial [Anaerolineae bacterium]|nr:hypothetical protein [Anaerolineae bacterium]